MTTKSSPPASSGSPDGQDAQHLQDARTASARKGAATVLRHKAELREEGLDRIRAQTADGTLTISYMTSEQRAAATEAAEERRTQNASRTKGYRSPNDRPE
jgi:hypothetical protein